MSINNKDEQAQNPPAGAGAAPMNRRRFMAVTCTCFACAETLAPRPALAGGGIKVDAGPLKNYAKDGIYDQYTINNFFIVRQKGRVFAVTATCPHKENALVRDSRNPNRITCTGHGAVFNAEGQRLEGPVKHGLERFPVTLNAEEHLLVSVQEPVNQSRWNDAGNFVKAK